MNYTEMETYFHELVSNVSQDSSTCIPCYNSLRCHFIFTNSCLNVEKKIRELCEVKGTNSEGQIQLNNVLHLIPKHEMGNPLEYDNLNAVKVEEHDQGENDDSKIDIKTECFMEITEQELNVRLDCSRLKIEQHYYGGYQDIEPFLGNKTRLDADTGITEEASEVTSYKEEGYDPQNCMLRYKNNSKVPLCYSEISEYQALLKGDLQVHMPHQKSNAEVPVYKCDMCAFQTNNKSSLRDHMLTHKSTSEVRLYRCEMCGYHTKYKHHLRTHMLTHKTSSEVPLHKCGMCSFQSKYKSSLQGHILTHKSTSEVRLYKCEKCAFQTRYKSSLQFHILTHKSSSEVRLYKCEMCTFQTKWKRYLQQHMLTHHTQSVTVILSTSLNF